MLISENGRLDPYDYRSSRFQKAFAFLKQADLKGLPLGRVEIDGDQVWAEVQEYTTMPWEETRFEGHRRYFDIQYVVQGQELMGCVQVQGLKEAQPYDEERDLVFFEEPAQAGAVLLKEGDWAAVPPKMAHKPRCAAGEACRVRKIVVKVKAPEEQARYACESGTSYE